MESRPPGSAQPERPLGGSVHATCVAVEGRGLLISGKSGSGKSALALELIALGARLVADDRCLLAARDGAVWAACPAPIRGKIEARFLGILQLDPVPEACLVAELDLDRPETERLPPERHTNRCGIALPLLLKPPGLHFAPALYLYLKNARIN